MKKSEYVIAFYMRLSKEDIDTLPGACEKKASASIENQRKLLYGFVSGQPEFQESSIIEKIDDGYTGTNFRRPQFQELLELAKSGKINCIIVKDFSRLGRDYIELGSYLEQVFPLLGIRVISINDGYDSKIFVETVGGFEIGFKNLAYELYSRDLSEKVKKSIRVKQKKGQYLAGCPLYGYQHAKEDKHKLVIDEESAVIVREIFRMRGVQMSSTEIAKSLNDRKVPTPAEYNFMKYGRKQRINLEGKALWTNQSVQRILSEERYTGIMVSHKHEAIGLRGPNRCIPSEDWIKVEGTQEAIIPREVFLPLQANKNKYEKSNGRKKRSIYTCGLCGHVLKKNRAKDYDYRCPYAGYESQSKCGTININGRILEQAVEATVKMQFLLFPKRIQRIKKVSVYADNRLEIEWQF